MSKNILVDDKYYTDAPPEANEALERSVEISADFLPPPDELAKAGIKKTISIRLDSSNIEFFKKAAAARGTHYQTMINDLLGEYVSQHNR
jgi:predicted DNA binding CopG/RHH family protein